MKEKFLKHQWRVEFDKERPAWVSLEIQRGHIKRSSVNGKSFYTVGHYNGEHIIDNYVVEIARRGMYIILWSDGSLEVQQ